MSDVTDITNFTEENANQFLVFNLGEEPYGVEILRVKEIIEYDGLTRVPMSPDYIKGVINLRGNVVPVVDVMTLFTRNSVHITAKTCIIIVEIVGEEESFQAGILVDSVKEVVDIQSENIDSAPTFKTQVGTDFIQGIGKIGDDFVILLNLKLLLSLDELSQISERMKNEEGQIVDSDESIESSESGESSNSEESSESGPAPEEKEMAAV